MKLITVLMACIMLVAPFVLTSPVYAQDASKLVEGRWSLEGTQVNNIGTSEEHTYSYSRKVRWSVYNGVFYQDGNDYSDTMVSGSTISAGYDKYGEKVTVRIEFTGKDTATYTREGTNEVFGTYRVNATATRVQ